MTELPQNQRPRLPELLAPAGHVEAFCAAVENGADAVYLGLKQLSARASANNFTLDELAALIPYARKRGVLIYVALNSLVAASQVSAVMDLLQSLADLEVDGLIVQDAGVFFLARRFFPTIPLHASTLMTVHNTAGVNQLERMGARRVVLARELTVQEVEAIATATQAPLEIFVHGALCYSYSGLCLASSFRGGHSGLQGRCVQPCRLKFKQGRKEGFFLSCSDICSLSLVPRLKRMRLSALKIEGRMKDAETIGRLVKAYRLVLDAPPEREEAAVAKAFELLAHSSSRRPTSGYLEGPFQENILAPHRSGSAGLWVGTVKGDQTGGAVVLLRHDIQPGDRLRPETAEGREKTAVTVTEIFSRDGTALPLGKAGEKVKLSGVGRLEPEARLFRVGVRTRTAPAALWKRIQSDAKPGSYRKRAASPEQLWEGWPALPFHPGRMDETLLLKVGAFGDLGAAFQSPAQWVILTATRSNMERLARQRLHAAQKKRFVWALPPLMTEKDVVYYRAAVAWYAEHGFASWEVNNWGHLDFFSGESFRSTGEKDAPRLNLMAGARLNVRNAAAMAAVADAGCRWAILSFEITGEELHQLTTGPLSVVPVVTVYAWPPLFTSRLVPKLLEDKPLFTPRQEAYFMRTEGHTSFIYADRPVNWFDKHATLQSYGYRCFLIDASEGPRPVGKDLPRLLSGFKRERADEPYSLFNFDRRP